MKSQVNVTFCSLRIGHTRAMQTSAQINAQTRPRHALRLSGLPYNAHHKSYKENVMELTRSGLELDELEANGIAKVCSAVSRLRLGRPTGLLREPTDEERRQASDIADLMVSAFGRTGGEFAVINPLRCKAFKDVAELAMVNAGAVVTDYCTPDIHGSFRPDLRAEAFTALADTAKAQQAIASRPYFEV